MICARIVGQGVPYRMPDAFAREVVERDGDGEYCPKSFWKDWYRRHGTAPAYAYPPGYKGPRHAS